MTFGSNSSIGKDLHLNRPPAVSSAWKSIEGGDRPELETREPPSLLACRLQRNIGGSDYSAGRDEAGVNEDAGVMMAGINLRCARLSRAESSLK